MDLYLGSEGKLGRLPSWYENYLVAKMLNGVTPYQISQEPLIWRRRTYYAELAMINYRKQQVPPGQYQM